MNSTGKGVLTEIYVDTDAEETTVVVINTYLAEVSADYNTKTEDVRLDVAYKDGAVIVRSDYGEDKDLSPAPGTSGEIGREDYGADQNLEQ